MKALVYTEPYHFEYTDVPDPKLGGDDVLVRVKACGICGSDVKGATGTTGRRIPPLIMGHEAAGIVERTGKDAKGFKTADRVCFDSTVYCNRCAACKAGLYNRCESRQVLGVATADFKRQGAFAELVAVPWWIVAKIPDGMSFVQAALLEPVSIAVHAANRAPALRGVTAVIIGAGTIGLFICQAVRLKGAKKVIVCDINEFRLATAEKLGADILVNPRRSDLKEIVLSHTQGRGADCVFEAVGFARTFSQAVSVAAVGGCVVAVGNLEKTADFDLQELVARELTFKGSYASSGEFRDCIGLIDSGKIDVQPLISAVVPLKDGADAFGRLLKGDENLLKIILQP